MKRRRRRLLMNNRARQQRLEVLKRELLSSANPPSDLNAILAAARSSAAPLKSGGGHGVEGSESTQTASMDTDSLCSGLELDDEEDGKQLMPRCSDTDTDLECDRHDEFTDRSQSTLASSMATGVAEGRNSPPTNQKPAIGCNNPVAIAPKLEVMRTPNRPVATSDGQTDATIKSYLDSPFVFLQNGASTTTTLANTTSTAHLPLTPLRIVTAVPTVSTTSSSPLSAPSSSNVCSASNLSGYPGQNLQCHQLRVSPSTNCAAYLNLGMGKPSSTLGQSTFTISPGDHQTISPVEPTSFSLAPGLSPGQHITFNNSTQSFTIHNQGAQVSRHPPPPPQQQFYLTNQQPGLYDVSNQNQPPSSPQLLGQGYNNNESIPLQSLQKMINGQVKNTNSNVLSQLDPNIVGSISTPVQQVGQQQLMKLVNINGQMVLTPVNGQLTAQNVVPVLPQQQPIVFLQNQNMR